MSDNLGPQFKRKQINKHDFWLVNHGKDKSKSYFSSCCNHMLVNTGRVGALKWSLRSKRTDDELNTFRSVSAGKDAMRSLHDAGEHEHGYENL
jgi:hypothetical protein